MWLTSFMTKYGRGQKGAVEGCVTSSENSLVGLSSSSKHADVPLVAPWGVVSVPPVGCEAVAVETTQGVACVGVKNQGDTASLEPGEIMLCSLGGACILLKNDGRVLINGKELGGV